MLVTNLYGGYLIYPDVEIDPYEIKEVNLNNLSNKTIISIYKLCLAHKVIVDTLVELKAKYDEAVFVESGDVDLTPYALKQEVEVKVDKEVGKSLSTNDFLNGYKSQLDNLNTNMSTSINQAIANVVNDAPSTFDTLKEIADWIVSDGVDATELASNLEGKANTIDLNNLTTRVSNTEGVNTTQNTSITNLQTSKANIVHTHAISDVNGLEVILDNKLWATGTAASATKLVANRLIAGVAFNGTADINLPGVNIAGNQNTTGNAATATKLATIRKINTVDFDGTADITIADSTKLPLTGGTVSGNVTITGTTTLGNALPLASGGTGVTSLADLKTSLGVPQFIQITLENYNLLTEGERNDTTKLYLIVG